LHLAQILFVALAAKFGLNIVMGAFTAGILVRLAVKGAEGELLRHKLDAVGYGFLIPIFFITAGMKFEVSALWSAPDPYYQRNRRFFRCYADGQGSYPRLCWHGFSLVVSDLGCPVTGKIQISLIFRVSAFHYNRRIQLRSAILVIMLPLTKF
jgi:hypothetical protein